MRIALVSRYYLPYQLGGIEFHVHYLSQELSKRGHDVCVFTSADSAGQSNIGKLGEEIRGKYKILYLKSKIGTIDPDLQDFDIIHIHEYFRSLADYLILKWSRIKPVVVTLHGGVLAPYSTNDMRRFLKLFHDRFLLRHMLSRAKMIVTVTNTERQFLITKYALDSSKLVTIPNGIPEEAFYPSTSTTSNNDYRYLLTIARLSKIKSINHVIEVLPYLPKDLHYIVAGPDDGELDNLKRLAVRLNVSERVHFIGPVYGEKKYELIRNALAFVLPSSYESQGIVLLEAMAHGIPSIATRVGGVSEILVHGETGFLYDYGDLASLQVLIEMCYHDNSMRLRVGKESLQRIKDAYNWSTIANRTIDVYNRAILHTNSEKTKSQDD